MLGGDGTILSALRRYAGRGVPVFAVNYGAIGFLATVEPDELEEGLRHALAGDFDVMDLPGARGRHRAGRADRRERHLVPPPPERPRGRAGLQRGRARSSARCAATGSWWPPPAGSTGYNLANGGPVLAWGVEGYVVSFIAPHTLTARALVVAPDDVLEVDEPLRRSRRST